MNCLFYRSENFVFEKNCSRTEKELSLKLKNFSFESRKVSGVFLSDESLPGVGATRGRHVWNCRAGTKERQQRESCNQTHEAKVLLVGRSDGIAGSQGEIG